MFFGINEVFELISKNTPKQNHIRLFPKWLPFRYSFVFIKIRTPLSEKGNGSVIPICDDFSEVEAKEVSKFAGIFSVKSGE